MLANMFRNGNIANSGQQKNGGEIAPAVLKSSPQGQTYIPMSNTFGSCESGSAAAPTMVATILIKVRLLRRLPRIWLAIHSSTSVSTPTALVGAQLSIAVSGDSATVRDGTGRPDAEAA